MLYIVKFSPHIQERGPMKLKSIIIATLITACTHITAQTEPLAEQVPTNCQELVTRFAYSDQFKTLAKLTPLTLTINSVLLVMLHDIIQGKRTNRALYHSIPFTLPLATLCTQCIYYSCDLAEIGLKKTAYLLQDLAKNVLKKINAPQEKNMAASHNAIA